MIRAQSHAVVIFEGAAKDAGLPAASGVCSVARIEGEIVIERPPGEVE